MLNGTIHRPGGSVLVSDIGPQPDSRNDSGSTLVCVTTNVNTACCRSNDNNALPALGHWYYPNSTKVPRGTASKELKLRGIGYTHQVRLARSPDCTPPPGVYTCIIPGQDGFLHNASITIDMGKLRYSILKVYYVIMKLLNYLKISPLLLLIAIKNNAP